MENSTKIFNEIENTNKEIEILENRLVDITPTLNKGLSDRKQAFEIYKKEIEVVKDQTSALSNEIYLKKIIFRILQNNYRYALVAEIVPQLKSILAAYNNKPYGEKTSRKIINEIKEKTGFYCYIRSTEITISTGNKNIIVSTEYNQETKEYYKILNDNNKIDISAMDHLHIAYEKLNYIDYPEEHAQALLFTHKKAVEAIEAANMAIDQFNNLCIGEIDTLQHATIRHNI